MSEKKKTKNGNKLRKILYTYDAAFFFNCDAVHTCSSILTLNTDTDTKL